MTPPDPQDDRSAAGAEHPPAGATQEPAEPRPRVGLWLGLLLLFVPVFYPLLYLRPYSWTARVGWGLWLGLIVFAKLSGMSEPVINLSELEQQVRQQEQGGPAPDRSVAGTFIQPDAAADPAAPVAAPPLEDYLRELGGGVLGRKIAHYDVDGDAIRLEFRPMDYYLDSEDAVTLESIGVALSLFYGRDFRNLQLDFSFDGRPLRVALTRADFERFFAMSGAQIRATLTDRAAQDASPFRAENIAPVQRRAFFEQFAAYR